MNQEKSCIQKKFNPLNKLKKSNNILFWLGAALVIGAASCNNEVVENKVSSIIEPYVLDIPYDYPQPLIPDDNELTHERIELGRKVFYEPMVSRDSSISCGSCHLQHIAFADTNKFSLGVEQRVGTRNAPGLFNLAYRTGFMRDGGVPTLEMQVLAPIPEHVEMDMNIIEVIDRFKADPKYVAEFKQAYDREPDPFSFVRAIAAFERTLISLNSPFDRDELSEEAKYGEELFRSDSLNCATCHSGFLFTNNEVTNNGLYLNYADSGVARLSISMDPDKDRALFLVPSLRNVALTAPYMHDGSFETLKDVLDHYETGGKAHHNKSDLLQPFVLSEKDESALIAFLESLTDESFTKNEKFSNPHKTTP